MTSRAHTDAIIALLAAAGWTPGVDLFDAEVVGIIGTPYTVVWPPPGVGSSSTIDAVPDEFTMTVQLSHVGGDRMEAQHQVDTARAALQGVTPTVTGRACAPIEQTSDGGPVTQDTDSRTPDARRAWLGFTFYRITSYPA